MKAFQRSLTQLANKYNSPLFVLRLGKGSTSNYKTVQFNGLEAYDICLDIYTPKSGKSFTIDIKIII